MSVSRVVVVVDSPSRARVSLREAARVASRFDAQLVAVLIEDEELLRLAHHGFARRYRESSPPGGFGPADVEREWVALADDLRAQVAEAARGAAVDHTFEVARGRAPETLEAWLAEGDVMLVAWAGSAPSGRATAPIRVLHDGSEAANRALILGARLAGRGGRLVVWIPAGAEVSIERAQVEVATVRVSALRDFDPRTVHDAIEAQPGGLLLVPRGVPLASVFGDRSVGACFPTSVLLVG